MLSKGDDNNNDFISNCYCRRWAPLISVPRSSERTFCISTEDVYFFPSPSRPFPPNFQELVCHKNLRWSSSYFSTLKTSLLVQDCWHFCSISKKIPLLFQFIPLSDFKQSYQVVWEVSLKVRVDWSLLFFINFTMPATRISSSKIYKGGRDKNRSLPSGLERSVFQVLTHPSRTHLLPANHRLKSVIGHC